MIVHLAAPIIGCLMLADEIFGHTHPSAWYLGPCKVTAASTIVAMPLLAPAHVFAGSRDLAGLLSGSWNAGEWPGTDKRIGFDLAAGSSINSVSYSLRPLLSFFHTKKEEFGWWPGLSNCVGLWE